MTEPPSAPTGAIAAVKTGPNSGAKPLEPLPGTAIDQAWCSKLQQSLLDATWQGAAATARVLPAAQLLRVFKQASDMLKAEPTLLQIKPDDVGNVPVIVVGDTHGQFHDVLRLFETAGAPGPQRVYVFNGDFVDRGAWGVETLALLLALKIALPRHVYLLRGNHESTYCTKYYGFQGELTAKYGPQHLSGVGDDEDMGEHDGAAAAAAAAAAEQHADSDHPHHQEQPDPEVLPDAAAAAAAGVSGDDQQQQSQRPRRSAAARGGRTNGTASAARAAAAAAAPRGAVAPTSRQQLRERAAKKDVQDLIKASRRLFALLPLGALVGPRTLVLHGGLFRSPPPAALKGKQLRAMRAGPLQLGTLDDLRGASKGGQDPNGVGASLVACDVLWSDPVMEPGLHENEARGGVGCVFGPDATEAFLSANGLRLVIRSHEGPDARLMRDDMGPMDEGYTIDHSVASGRLLTVFSAPDYPQFQAVEEEEERTRNKAAAVKLVAPGWDEPQFVQWDAALPRPKADPYYDFQAPTELGSSSSEDEGDEAASARGRAADRSTPGHQGYGSRSSSPPHKARRASDDSSGAHAGGGDAKSAAAAEGAAAAAGKPAKREAAEAAETVAGDDGPPSKRLRHSHADSGRSPASPKAAPVTSPKAALVTSPKAAGASPKAAVASPKAPEAAMSPKPAAGPSPKPEAAVASPRAAAAPRASPAAAAGRSPASPKHGSSEPLAVVTVSASPRVKQQQKQEPQEGEQAEAPAPPAAVAPRHSPRVSPLPHGSP